MKTLARDFVGGYYLTALTDPGLLRGVRYVHSYPCGTVGTKRFTYIKFTPGELPDTLGEHQEMFDISGIGADEAATLLLPTIATGDISGFAPSAVERVAQAMAEGLSAFDACMLHIARLIPEYCGATFAEAIEYKPDLLVETTDPETGAISYNIQRCSEE